MISLKIQTERKYYTERTYACVCVYVCVCVYTIICYLRHYIFSENVATADGDTDSFDDEDGAANHAVRLKK